MIIFCALRAQENNGLSAAGMRQQACSAGLLRRVRRSVLACDAAEDNVHGHRVRAVGAHVRALAGRIQARDRRAIGVAGHSVAQRLVGHILGRAEGLDRIGRGAAQEAQLLQEDDLAAGLSRLDDDDSLDFLYSAGCLSLPESDALRRSFYRLTSR